MSMYSHVNETLQKEFKRLKTNEIDFGRAYREKLVGFRHSESSVERVEKPSNLARARSLGYKAKQGIIVVRARVRKGSGTKTRPNKRRRPKRMGVNKLTRKISIRSIAEQRAARKFPNLQVLNSYFAGEDGIQKYFEVIMVDVNHPAIKSDKELKGLVHASKGRAFRGLTASMQKSRGLRR
ncbi:50S ribosomal protein L15e [archaeon]|nr:50S ribosomal protein L15e [archaeon]